MSLIEDYIDTVHDETGMWAAYPPNVELEVGDYGTVKDGQFRRLGNIAQLSPRIDFESELRGEGMSREFKTKRVRKVTMAAGAKVDGGIVTVKPSLELSFGEDFSVYFAVAGCRCVQIKNLQAVAQKLAERYRNDRWKEDWVVITSVFHASNLTVVVSQEKGSKIVLEAKADVPRIDMADANLSLQVLYDDSSSEQWITEKPGPDKRFTPFYWAHKITTNIFGANASLDHFESLVDSGAPSAAEAPEVLVAALIPMERERDPLAGWSKGR